MKIKSTLTSILIWVIAVSSFAQVTGTFTDSRDGKIYKTVTIGTQTWMAENLAYKPDSGNYWAYDNKQKNISKDGYLYDWKTANKIAPSGWHLPSIAEWDTLHKFLGDNNAMVYTALIKGGKSGFNALLDGCRDNKGSFYMAGTLSYFWSSSFSGDNDAWTFCCMSFGGVANILTTEKGFGNSVRLIKD
jgi:uncharacterized protein (TIGR02145 family)